MPLQYTCHLCQRAFTVPPSRVARSGAPVFCSMACYTASRAQRHVDRPCVQCGAIIHAGRISVKAARRFCSAACYNAHRAGHIRTAVEVPCAYCSSLFYAPPYQVRGGRRYCSDPCYLAGHARRQVTCQRCGRLFPIKPSELQKGKRYCSHTCKGLAMRRGRAVRQPRKSAEYADWRLAVWQRDQYTCQHCHGYGKSLPLHAHHIAAWLTNPELRFEVSNGLTLCWPCHIKEHRRLRGLAHLLKPARQLTMRL